MNAAALAMLAAYKLNTAGAYRSCTPGEMLTVFPPGPCIVSEKIDGETWFLQSDGEECVLLSPFGKSLVGIPLTQEAERTLHGWCGLLAGELYAAVDSGRPHVFDLHAALGGGAHAQTERLRFAAFDVLVDGGEDVQRKPFAERLARLQQIVDHSGERFHLAPFQTTETAADVVACYERLVTQNGAEGIVVHAADGRTYKVKPEITLDAAVVAYAASASGVSELLLALLKPDGAFQLIGRVKTGWSRAENADLLRRLAPLACGSSYRTATDHGALHRWVKPKLIVEIKCNDLIAANSKDEPVRRMALRYGDEIGWSPSGPTPAISMINSVFRRIRDDKKAVRPDVRWEQVSDLAPVELPASIDPASLPASEIIRREVYIKKAKGGLTIRKLVVWRTNKRETDASYPAYAVCFTDYAPGRKLPLKTDLRVASTEERMHTLADDWLAANIKRGWTVVEAPGLVIDKRPTAHATKTIVIHSETPVASHIPPTRRTLTIAFARSTSPTFPIIRRRLDALAKLGTLDIATDDKGREAWFELSITQGLVENARRIANLLQIVTAWKTTEVSLDGELLGKHDLQDFMNRLEDTRRCWLKRKSQGSACCARDCILGCDALRIRAFHDFLAYAGNEGPAWWAVGSFDGKTLRVDREGLKQRLDGPLNDGVRICPHFDLDGVLAKIDALPDAIETGAEGWITLYNNDGKPAWLWPADRKIPPTLRATLDNPWRSGGLNIRVGFGKEEEHRTDGQQPAVEEAPSRAIPSTRYTDIHGQNQAVEAVRDLVELPLRHADLFTRIGARPKAGGVILAGPPGTGKTLLARAVAGECGAHIESVSGPELLSKWVGETESALRTIFERAKSLAPSVILFDEIDCLAASRDSADAQYQKSMVTQLLALLDGLEERGNVFVIATTNRPGDIDPALRRPGRFDQIIQMGPPDETGRAAIFRNYLEPLVLDPTIDRERLSAELAALTPSLTGADIAHACHKAARLCVKDASRMASPPADLAICEEHFQRALRELAPTRTTRKPSLSSSRSEPPAAPVAFPEPFRHLMRG